MGAYWAALLAAIVTSMGGQTALKAGAGAPSFIAQVSDWRTVVGLALYAVAALLYIVALRRIAMSVALPCTAISYVAAALLGHWLFHEALTPMHLVAIGLIIAGVLTLAFA
jgi:multidrug transporter EmrE-like cation transporter